MNAPANLYAIDAAVNNARRYANHLYNTARRADDYDRARDAERIAHEGEAELRKLSSAWGEIKALIADRNRAYDAYVTNVSECCSCHIIAPCSYCTSQPDEGVTP